MSPDLFAAEAGGLPIHLDIGAALLPGFAVSRATQLHREIGAITSQAAFRHMLTPGGQRMSVAMTNCGSYGWVSDKSGYRYSPYDPLSARAWPILPAVFCELARAAAACVGFDAFVPDACLINRYEPGARLALHQDRDECDFTAPIVSVSLGLPAVFLFGGQLRSDRPTRLQLMHGDVVVWGGPARLRFHGVQKLATGIHPQLGAVRYNLTLRKAA